jgi:aldose sugar dehydrogenase
MINKFLCLGILVSIFFACSSTKNNLALAKTDRDHKALYSEFCSSCHGKQGESFRLKAFKYGNTEAAISKSISTGIVAAGMPAYGNSFSKNEIVAMTNYIQQLSKLPKVEINNSTYFKSEVMNLQLDSLTTEVNTPWAIEFLPDRSMLITDRDGDFYRRTEAGQMIKIANVPKVNAKSQGGLLDVLVHPDFNTNKIIYLSFSKPKMEAEKTLSTTAVIMAKLENDALVDVKEIFEALPYFSTNHHYGSRMIIDKDKYLFITVGERGKENENPQNLKSMLGKIHRLHDDGSIPKDNPYLGQEGIAPSTWSWGHRNPQSIAIHPTTGEIWANEHGPKGGDEINIVKPKNNYGWPVTTYGINYNGTKITDKTSQEGVTDPIHYWLPSIGPSDGLFVTSDLYGSWKGNYLASSLSFSYLERCTLDGNKVVKREKLFEGIGRVRSIKQGPDGLIYMGLETPGRIYVIRPIW